jgi:hypothetical protein
MYNSPYMVIRTENRRNTVNIGKLDKKIKIISKNYFTFMQKKEDIFKYFRDCVEPNPNSRFPK